MQPLSLSGTVAPPVSRPAGHLSAAEYQKSSSKVSSDSISAAVRHEIPNQATYATVGALRPRSARPANNSFTEFNFNQAWLAES